MCKADPVDSVKGEVSGLMSIPYDVHIECTIVSNTFAYNERNESSDDNTRRWRQKRNFAAGSHAIPEPVLTLQVKIGSLKGTRVDAVVVVEHRNIQDVMTDSEHSIKNVIIIMVRISNDKGTIAEIFNTDFWPT